MRMHLIEVLCLVFGLVSGAFSTVVPCNHSVECAGTPGTECVSDFCQPSPCSADSQCVQQQICSHDHTGRDCVYSIDLKAEETSPFTLRFASPVKPGTTFEVIRWYRGSRAESIVYYAPTVNEGSPKYFGGFCAQSCNASNRVTLDVTSGDLTIHEINLRDEHFYYYKYSVSGEHEKGSKYEIKLEVKSPSGSIDLYVGVVVAVVVVLSIIICCVILAFRYKKMRKRLSPIYRRKVPQEDPNT